MYKELKKQIDYRPILESSIRGLEDRIRIKIQKQLGLHATTYAELKIECPKVEDKYLKVFSQIEELDHDLQGLKEELEIIDKSLKEAREVMEKANDRDMNIFRSRFFLGLTVRETAERLHFTEDYIKERTRKMLKK